jgi:hypothetical protein
MILDSGIRNRRIGKWVWALSAEEGLTAVLVERAQREDTPVSTKLKRRYAAMLEKQRKLLARNRTAAASNVWAGSADDGHPADGQSGDGADDDDDER